MSEWGVALGKAVRELRLEKGWSQHELAEEAGLELKYVNPFENGRRKNPKFSTIVALAGALEVPVVELFERAEGMRRAGSPAKGRGR